jgi:hypothetical protein
MAAVPRLAAVAAPLARAKAVAARLAHLLAHPPVPAPVAIPASRARQWQLIVLGVAQE